jgi:mannosyl-glycoprotein endo-beta-N-acetylglucosaminidase
VRAANLGHGGRAARVAIAVTGALCLVLGLAALPAGAAAATPAPTAAAAPAPPPNACGDYQCFYGAEDFLQSVPAPKPAQRATLPLAARAVGAAPGTPSMLVGLDDGPWSFWDVSDGAAQGRSGVIGGVPAGNVFNFTHWQYVDALYYYLHETVSVPPTQWVNAGHRNGVPVLGTVTPDCSVCGPEAAKLFTPDTSGRTVRKLYDYAAAYGFDGWMIDIEGDDFVPSPSLLDAVRQLTAMRLPDGRALRVALYHGNEFALGPLLPYFRAGALWQSDYDSSTRWPAQTYRTLRRNGLLAQRRRAFWASYVYAYQGACKGGARTSAVQISNGNRTPGMTPKCLDTAALFRNQRAVVPSHGGPRSYTGAALFAPIWPFVGNLPDRGAPASRTRVHAADDALWVGGRYSGPACRRRGTRNAVAAMVTPRSVLGHLPFVTSFDTGEGDAYAVQGTEVAADQWNDLSVQDVLPTWSCTVRGRLTAAPTYAGAVFNGGSALRLGGFPGEVQLYTADIPVGSDAKPVLAFESETRSGPAPYIRISYGDGTSDLVRATADGPRWKETTRPLAARGKTIVAISVGTRGPSRARVAAWIGQVRLYDARTDAAPEPVTVDATGPVITWPSGKAVASWNVYESTPTCLRFLGPAVTNHYDLVHAMFPASPGGHRFVVQPVAETGSVTAVGPPCAPSG